jgi:hypothetical protein
MAGGLRDSGNEELGPNEMRVTALWNQHAQLASFAILVGWIRRLSPDRVFNRGWFLTPISEKKEPPTNNVERFLAMLRFDSREKLKDLSLE